MPNESSDNLGQKSRRGTFEAILPILAKHGIKGRALDIPAGPGRLSVLLKEKGFSVESAELEIPAENPHGLSWHRADLDRDLPFESESFDLVVCSDGIEHVENPFHTFREFRRVTRPGGHVLIATPNYLNIEKRLRFLMTGRHTKPLPSLARRADDLEKKDLGHINPLTYTRLKDVVTAAGMTVTDAVTAIAKPKQIFLWPASLIIQIGTLLQSAARREHGDLDTVNSRRILMGGHKLYVLARR